MEKRILVCWEPYETDSWNPDLIRALRREGAEVVELHDLPSARSLDLAEFDVCLPRFRVGAANMAWVDELVEAAGLPVLNSRMARLRCENKALAHLAFEERGIPQPRTVVVGDEGHPDREPTWSGETLVKPVGGNRAAGIEVFPTLDQALGRACERCENVLVQEMIWPARSWRVIVGRESGVVDPYWRRPPSEDERILSISSGSEIVRERSERVERIALEMREAVDGDLLAVDVLETEDAAFALEINHNFDAHGGTAPAVEAFIREIEAKALPKRVARPPASSEAAKPAGVR